VRQGTVLYLALEDDFPRLQNRLYRMFNAEVAKYFYLSTWAKQTGSGLEEQVEGFVTTHADTRLVIIDTLQRVRPADGNLYSYATDYEIIMSLSTLASKLGICLLIIYHTRK
jgi:RecA-family ATPase